MPLYDYKCQQCGKIAEVRHGFNDRYDEPCPACGGPMHRVFSAAPIVFKGSGYYVTDTRKSDTPAASESSSTKSETSPKSDASTAGKSEPAA